MPCTVLVPSLEEKVIELKGQIAFTKINIDEQRFLAVQNGVKSVPCIHIYNKGTLIRSTSPLLLHLGHVGIPTDKEIGELMATAVSAAQEHSKAL